MFRQVRPDARLRTQAGGAAGVQLGAAAGAAGKAAWKALEAPCMLQVSSLLRQVLVVLAREVV